MEIRELSIYVLEKSRADWLKLKETELHAPLRNDGASKENLPFDNQR